MFYRTLHLRVTGVNPPASHDPAAVERTNRLLTHTWIVAPLVYATRTFTLTRQVSPSASFPQYDKVANATESWSAASVSVTERRGEGDLLGEGRTSYKYGASGFDCALTGGLNGVRPTTTIPILPDTPPVQRNFRWKEQAYETQVQVRIEA